MLTQVINAHVFLHFTQITSPGGSTLCEMNKKYILNNINYFFVAFGFKLMLFVKQLQQTEKFCNF